MEVKTYGYAEHDFAIMHLASAGLFTRRCFEIDRPGAKSDTLYELRTFSTNAVISSFSFLEAQVNQLFINTSMSLNGETKPILNGYNLIILKILADLWNLPSLRVSESANAIDKYNLILHFSGKPIFADKGEPIYQQVNLLRIMRNMLVHAKPSRQEIGKESEIEKKLKKSFDENHFFRETGNPFWPERCFGYSCAAWSIHSVLEFTDEFFKRLGVLPPYDNSREAFKTRPSQ